MHVKRHANERGANLVEAAVVIPLLLILLVCVVDLGRTYFAYITLIDAAREGARYGASHYADTNRNTQIYAVTLAEAANQPIVSLTSANVSIEPTGAGTQGAYVKVTVHIDQFPLFLGTLVGRPTIPISYAVAFRIRCDYGSTC